MSIYNAMTTTKMPTLAEVAATMRKIEKAKSSVPDVLLLTVAVERELLKQIPQADATECYAFRAFYGIPYETFSDPIALFERAADLREAGKRVAVIVE